MTGGFAAASHPDAVSASAAFGALGDVPTFSDRPLI